MEAKYFYNRLLKYEKDSKESGKHCYDYSNGTIRIHRRKDRDTKYFTINALEMTAKRNGWN